MSTIIKKNTQAAIWPEPGTWRAWRRPTDGRLIASVCCPNCGTASTADLHEVARDGTMTPSLICPAEHCTFHDQVILEGWTP